MPAFELQFPRDGMARALAYAKQAPTTTPYCINVWPFDLTLERDRGGSRPGHEKFFTTDTGGMPDLIAEVSYLATGVYTNRVVVANGGTLYAENFSGGVTAVTSGITLDTGRPLGYAELYQKLYILGSNDTNAKLCVYDPSANTLALAVKSTAADIPEGAELMCPYNNRLVLARFPSNPQNWAMSRQGDPLDWDDAVEDDEQAAVTSNNSDQGKLGEEITALIPHNQDCMFFGCTSSIWAMQGDIQSGGRLVRIADNIGVWGPRSWCYDTDGYLYFLSFDGLYMMAPGCGSQPKPVSRDRLPQELLGINRTTQRVSMAYDQRFRGVLIAVTSISGTNTSTMFFVRLGEGGASFWPTSFASSSHHVGELYSLRNRIPTTAGGSIMLLGCRDGYIRNFNRTVSNDDGTSIVAELQIGAFPLGDSNQEGLLQKVEVAFGASTGSVNCEIRAARSAQEAYDASSSFVAALTQSGLNRTFYPRVRGHSCLLKFTNSGLSSSVFSFEQIYVSTMPFGSRRP